MVHPASQSKQFRVVVTNGPITNPPVQLFLPFEHFRWWLKLRDLVIVGACPLLIGHFASGKTSGAHLLARHFKQTGQFCSFYVTGTLLNYTMKCVDSIEHFVVRLCQHWKLEKPDSLDFAGLASSISKQNSFNNILFFDEIDALHDTVVWNSLKDWIQDVRRSPTSAISYYETPRIIHSVICIGSVMNATQVSPLASSSPSSSSSASSSLRSDFPSIVSSSNTSSSFSFSETPAEERQPTSGLDTVRHSRVVSPWNAESVVETEHFTRLQFNAFFSMLCSEFGYKIPDLVLDEVWSRTQGHPALVCYFAYHLGRIIGAGDRQLRYDDWLKASSEIRSKLQEQVIVTNIFRVELLLSLISFSS